LISQVQRTGILIARKPKNLLKAASQRNIIKHDHQPNPIASIPILYSGALHLQNRFSNKDYKHFAALPLVCLKNRIPSFQHSSLPS
jgi:prepilin signal peptidase PulO-like enzyme (type II secretory pathway)